MNFCNRFNELLAENNISYSKMIELLGLNYASIFYKWKNGECLPKINYLIKIADVFNCNLDYLLARTQNFEQVKTKKLIPFHVRLNEALIIKNKTKYQFIKETKFNKGHLYAWFNKLQYPTTENLIYLADYLGVSVDYLVGRV